MSKTTETTKTTKTAKKEKAVFDFSAIQPRSGVYKIPVSEINNDPSMLVEADPNSGVQSQLTREQRPPQFNGKSIDDLRDESSLNRLGKFEQLATAEKIVSENMKVYKKSGFATQFAKNVQLSKKP